MNYEEMYQDLQPDQKVLKDSLAALQKFYKAVCKETVAGFDEGTYFEGGNFAEQMLAARERRVSGL